MRRKPHNAKTQRRKEKQTTRSAAEGSGGQRRLLVIATHAVETLFGQLGCPEDMLSFLRPEPSWRKLPPRVDPYAATAFLGRMTA